MKKNLIEDKIKIKIAMPHPKSTSH